MRADWTASGACTTGSTAPPRAATRSLEATGGATTTSTTSAEPSHGCRWRNRGDERSRVAWLPGPILQYIQPLVVAAVHKHSADIALLEYLTFLGLSTCLVSSESPILTKKLGRQLLHR